MLLMSMVVWAYMAIYFLLMYGSHDMRHKFLPVDGGQRDPRDLGRLKPFDIEIGCKTREKCNFSKKMVKR